MRDAHLGFHDERHTRINRSRLNNGVITWEEFTNQPIQSIDFDVIYECSRSAAKVCTLASLRVFQLDITNVCISNIQLVLSIWKLILKHVRRSGALLTTVGREHSA
jgi:hypothetical protein